MAQLKNFLSTRWGIISVGAFIGVIAGLELRRNGPRRSCICSGRVLCKADAGHTGDGDYFAHTESSC